MPPSGKDAGVVIPTTSSFNLPIWPVQKRDAPLRMTLDYCKINQVVTPIAADVPDVVSLLEQIITHSGTWYAATDLANGFSLYQSIWTTRHNFLSAGKASNTLLLVYLRTYQLSSLVEFTSEATWSRAFLCWEVFYYWFVLCSSYVSIQILYFFVIQFSYVVCFQEFSLFI